MFPCRSSNCSKCTLLVADVHSGGAVPVGAGRGPAVYRKLSVLPVLKFCLEPKTALKLNFKKLNSFKRKKKKKRKFLFLKRHYK